MIRHIIPATAGLVLAAISVFAPTARADTINLKDGSVIHGKI